MDKCSLRLMHQAPFSHCTGCSWYHPGFMASPPVGIQHSQFRTILSASTQHLELMVTLKSLAAQNGIYMGLELPTCCVPELKVLGEWMDMDLDFRCGSWARTTMKLQGRTCPVQG